MTAPLTRSFTYTFDTRSSSPSYRPSDLRLEGDEAAVLTDAGVFVSQVETGAGNGATAVELPDRIAVVPAGSVAADAETAEQAPGSASTARVISSALGVMPGSDD